MKNRATLHIGGLTRTYVVHLPVAYTPGRAYPLVLAFHGRGTTASWMARRTHLNSVADEHHFLVVYPDGYKEQWGDGRGNTPSERDGVDDVAFIATLIETLRTQLHYRCPAHLCHRHLQWRLLFLPPGLPARRKNRGDCAGRGNTARQSDRGASGSSACASAAYPWHKGSTGTRQRRGAARGRPYSLHHRKCRLLGQAQRLLSWHTHHRKSGSSRERWHVGAAHTLSRLPTTGQCRALHHRQRWPRLARRLSIPAGLLIGKTSRNLDASAAIWDFFEAHPMR